MKWGLCRLFSLPPGTEYRSVREIRHLDIPTQIRRPLVPLQPIASQSIGGGGLQPRFGVKMVGVSIGSLFALSVAGCSSSPAGFPSGSGVATITWHRVATTSSLQSPPQPFSGTIAGIPVSGRSVTPVPKADQNPGGGISIPSHLVLARWTGTFQGTNFEMTVSVGQLSLTNLSSVTFDISGKFGSQSVHGTGRATSNQQSQLTFQGTVGHHHVVGSIKEPVEQNGLGTATATFTVTG